MTTGAAAEKRFFILSEGKELGPFARADIDRFISDRRVRSDTPVRFEDSPQWIEAAKIFSSRFMTSADSISGTSSNFNKSVNGKPNRPYRSRYPEEAMQWSWAAFLWGPIWAIFHKVWWGLAAFIPIPFLGLAVCIGLGILGRRQAWDAKCWQSVKHMQQRGKFWVRLWFIVWGSIIVGTLVFLWIGFILTKR